MKMLSVVIAARNAVGSIVPCVVALEAQAQPDMEVLVADASEDGTAELMTRRFPWVRLVRCPTGSSLAELRAAALAASEGEIVAFTDVYCRVEADWVQRLSQEPWQSYAAAGGVVAPAPRTRLTDWAAFLCEYAPHLPASLSLPAGPATLLPGNNIAFRRDALVRAQLVGEREFWKVFALWRLAALGERFWVDPGLVVRHDRSTPTSEFAYHRYLHGRCFGANRTATRPWVYKLARAATCPAVPLLLTARLVHAVHGHRTFRRVLWQSLPFSVLFHVAWGWGELEGYLRGPGEACVRLA